MNQKRFIDDEEYLSGFSDEFLVVCPRCSKCAKVIIDLKRQDASLGWRSPRRVVCSSCAYHKVCDLQVANAIAEIEAEMKNIGYWDTEPLPPQAYDFQEAFAMDTMAFSQWLQFVFIPRVKQIVQDNEEFPLGSMVAVPAMREFDHDQDADRLVELLSEFDTLFDSRA